MDDHYRSLIDMYLGAEVQKKYPGIQLEIQNNAAAVSLDVDSSYHHAGGYLHGSVYFRILDDACYFAFMSNEKEYFYVTRSFTIDYLRPYKEGRIIAKSTEIRRVGDDYHVDGIVYSEEGKELAKGTGIFSKSRVKLNPEIGYRLS